MLAGIFLFIVIYVITENEFTHCLAVFKKVVVPRGDAWLTYRPHETIARKLYGRCGELHFVRHPNLQCCKHKRCGGIKSLSDGTVPREELPRIKKTPFPLGQGSPLSNLPLPPWALDLVNKQEVDEPYVPRHYSQEEIMSYVDQLNAETRSKVKTCRLDETQNVKPKSYGFKFKQIQPVRHHNGKAFTFFYVHSLHTDVIPVLLNSLRRVAKRHLGAGRITALRIPGLENEFYSVVGLREDYFDLVKNLRGIVFRNVPETATFKNPLIGRLRLKGPIIAVAGHIELDFEDTSVIGSSSGSTTDRKVDIVNKNHYICTLSNGTYLTMDVKIEYISNHVIPEYGPESLNRDVTEDGFIHFCSSCLPVEMFGFRGDRRGIDEFSTSEIVTLELHTDGSTTPRLALLKSVSFLSNWFERTLKALRSDCLPDYLSIESSKCATNLPELMHPELHRNVPWNPYRLPEDRISAHLKWFYRRDVRRQYKIDPESRMAKEEQLADWQEAMENQLLFEQQIPPVLSDEEDNNERVMDRRDAERLSKEENPPSWVFKDPMGPGNLSQRPLLDFDQNVSLTPLIGGS